MTKIIFDWGYHGGNRNKKKSLNSKNEQSCDFCQRPDSNLHWMSDCTHPASVVLRTQALHELREHVGMLSRQLKDISCDEKESSCSPQLQTNLGIESTVYQYILKTYDKEDVGTRIWTSNWTLDMQNGLVDEIYKSNLGESMITLSNVNVYDGVYCLQVESLGNVLKRSGSIKQVSSVGTTPISIRLNRQK